MFRTIAATIAAVLALGVAGPASAGDASTTQPSPDRSRFLCPINEPCPILPPCEWKRGCNTPETTPTPSPSCKWKVKRHQFRACLKAQRQATRLNAG